MPQSYQDDLFEVLESFAETTYIYLVLVALQRRLNQDEIYLLERAAQAADHWNLSLSLPQLSQPGAPSRANNSA